MEPTTEYGLKQLRVITDTTADGAGSPRQYKCRPNFLGPGVWGDAAASRAERWPVPDVSSSALVCDSGDGAEPWMFFGNTYTHAMIYGGPPDSGRDPNIWIAYGICTPF